VTFFFSYPLFQSFLSFLSPVQEDKDDCIKYFSLTSCSYCLISVEGHGLRVSKNTVVKEFVDWGCVRTEGTGECLNQRQSKWQEPVESCIICTAFKVLGKFKARISIRLGCVAASETRKKKTCEIELENVKETACSKDLYYDWMIG